MTFRFKAALAASSAALVAGLSVQASAETIEETAARFGARESILDISLSPDGNKIAYIAPYGTSGEALYVVDLAGDATPQAILTNSDVMTDIARCRWASDARIVCNAYVVDNAAGTLLGFTRMFILNSDGSNIQSLTRSASSRAMGINQFGGAVLALEIRDEPGKLLMSRELLAEVDIGTRTANKDAGLAVEEVDIETLRSRRVEQPNEEAIGYIADETGVVRIMSRIPPDTHGNMGERVHFYYRTGDSDKWLELGQSEIDAQGNANFVPVAVDAASNRAFVFEKTNGFDALYAISLDGSMKREQLLARSDVDVDQLVRIGRKGRVVGASYATEKRVVEYVDPELKRLAAGLAKALPGKPQIGFAGASADESKLLVVASSDVHPGMTYLYDKGTGQLSELLPIRAPLADREMGQMKPANFTASDGTAIPAYLTLPAGASSAKGLSAIVLPHGAPSARDEWGFDWLVQFFAARGYAVLQPNYRGSSGYGAAWFGKNGFQAWRTAVGDVNDAGRWLVSQGVDSSKLAIVGWSYGGYAALQSQVLDQNLFKAVVAIAPVTDLEQLRQDARPYTSYALVDRFIGRGDHVRAGSPAKNVDRIIAPVMLVHGTFDQNVDVAQSRLMERELEDQERSVRYLEFKDLDHSLDDSAARRQMLTEIDGFLAASLGR